MECLTPFFSINWNSSRSLFCDGTSLLLSSNWGVADGVRPWTVALQSSLAMADFVASITSVAQTVKLPTSFCDASDKYNFFVADLTVGLGGINFDKIHEHAIAANMASGALLLAGTALVAAPVVFGRYWLKPVLTTIALLLGAIGSGILLQDQGADLFDIVLKMASIPEGEATCGTLLGVQLLSSILLALFINQIPSLAFFAIGAAGAGFSAYVGIGLLVPLLNELSFMPTMIVSFIEDLGAHETYAISGVVAMIGGLLFGKFKEQLIDLTLGLLGGALMAMGLINFVTMDVLDAETLAKFQVQEFYMAYIVALVVVIEALRYLLIKVRMGDFASAVDQMPGQTLMKKAAAVSPSKGGKGAARKTPNTKAGKGMY